MDTREYIESGILELYVYGLLSEEENLRVTELAKEHREIHEEVLSIEKAIVDLSTSFSPLISAEVFEAVREKLQLKHAEVPVVEMKRRTNWSAYLGWAAAVLFLLGVGYLYKELDERNERVANVETERTRLRDSLSILELRNRQTESALAVIRDEANVEVTLGGATAAPDASAKVYWNKDSQIVYVDASRLPEPPQGMVYQVWSLKLKPALTPTSIGLLENFAAVPQKIFTVSPTADAEAFGITLEPAGGSASPTMEQLYAFGQVRLL